MPAKKKGRTTPKGTQPKATGKATRKTVPPTGRDNQATPELPGAAPRARATPNKSATFRHRSR